MNNGFNIDKSEIDNIFRIYQQRKVNEEIEYINSTHKGIAGLAKKLKTDLSNGISNSTLELRRQAFDNNLRYREPMPSFWFFVKDAFGLFGISSKMHLAMKFYKFFVFVLL